ncbi:phage major capsid protein [Actinocrispum wychmicini]|uniref:phage major capsid protein n=1 Tax=Actinocrispum wychmicini TaxID=1213861 RepID=UPI001A9E3F38|nr:phage major capsid protein [Actinocrispum wychmicini]
MNTKRLRVEVKDPDRGEVTAVFATLNAIDSDGDVAIPGAFTDGAPVRISAYGHTTWQGALPVGKGVIRTTEREAILDGQFFLDTTAGRDTFAVVKQMGELREWPYGYDPVTFSYGEQDDRPVRFLEAIRVYEVSPVLRGAGVDTRTLAVKSGPLTLVDEARAVLAAVTDLNDRAADVVAKRRPKGKGLGLVSAELLTDLDTELARLASLLTEPGADSGAPSAEPTGTKSFGDLFTESVAYKGVQGQVGPEAHLDVELKTLFSTTAGWLPETFRTGKVVEFATRPVQIIDIIPATTTSQAAVVYMEETVFTNTAAETAEAGAYPEAGLQLTEQTSPVRKVSVWLPVTDEQLDDEPQARGYVDNRMPFMLRQRLDAQILIGKGPRRTCAASSTPPVSRPRPRAATPVPDAIYKGMVKVPGDRPCPAERGDHPPERLAGHPAAAHGGRPVHLGQPERGRTGKHRRGRGLRELLGALDPAGRGRAGVQQPRGLLHQRQAGHPRRRARGPAGLPAHRVLHGHRNLTGAQVCRSSRTPARSSAGSASAASNPSRPCTTSLWTEARSGTSCCAATPSRPARSW